MAAPPSTPRGSALCPWSEGMITQDSSSDHGNSRSGTQSPVSTPDTASCSSAPSPINLACLSYLPPEAQYLAELGNYLPLGCLFPGHSGDGEHDELDPAALDWKELTFSLAKGTLALPSELESDLTKLQLARWIRVFCKFCELSEAYILRVYVLPMDVGRRFVDRNSKVLHAALQQVIAEIDISPNAWAGYCIPDEGRKLDLWASAEDSSLFYIFNTLPSPAPAPQKIRDKYTKVAAQRLLRSKSPIRGLKTTLYPYQARSAASMLQRETAPGLQLDPRLEVRYAPDGQVFYYDARNTTILRAPRYYELNKGGMLAETMGLGKTLICLAVILATKHHLPLIPPYYQEGPPRREKVGSLVSMAANTLHRHSVSARMSFERLKETTGNEMSQCIKELEKSVPSYSIPVQPARFNRKTRIPHPRKLTLCSGTIVVVPGNLVHQWRSELKKHVVEGDDGLRMLVMDNSKQRLPSAMDLCKYNVILFSRTRFEAEIRDGSDNQGRRRVDGTPLACRCPYIGASRRRDCNCLQEDDIYQSPLKELHWLRIIIDEGHAFSSRNSNAVLVAEKLVQAERRWVVSGTPARDRLFGVEVDLATNDDTPNLLLNEERSEPLKSRELALEKRRHFNADEEKSGAAKNLGLLACHFLQARPWSETDEGDRLEWDDYIYRHEDYRRRTYSGFSLCLRRTLEGLMVKTQVEDVEKDIVLPPLDHRVVYLEPSFYDKLTANLFILVLTANAVTSEREDQDYLFHKNSQKARYQLLTNLRQSNFFWTGFSKSEVLAAIQNGQRYLEKDNKKCAPRDCQLLVQCMELAQVVLSSPGWEALSVTHEVGLFVKDWPGSSGKAWSLADTDSSLLIGVTQLIGAQTHVNRQLTMPDATEGFEVAGETAMAEARAAINCGPSDPTTVESTLAKTGVPLSSIHGEPSVPKRHSAKNGSPRKKGSPRGKKSERINEQTPDRASKGESRKRSRSIDNDFELPEDSPLRRTQVVGTTSAKLSYLIDRIMTYQHDEKILIFYDGDNTAFYIAQCLELLHVKHLIYSKELKNEKRSLYIVTFDQDDSVRVLLMDIRCGALGLNVNKASRVFFINPCGRPSIEAQAIKRAHRIGQTRPVFVETLVLKGAIEEAIFERAKAMTRTEHMQTKTLEDDKKITHILQHTQPIPVDPSDGVGARQMAPLQTPQQVFGRAGRGDTRIDNVDVHEHNEQKPVKRPRKSKSATSRSSSGPGTVASSRASGASAAASTMLPSSSRIPGPAVGSSLFGGSSEP